MQNTRSETFSFRIFRKMLLLIKPWIMLIVACSIMVVFREGLRIGLFDIVGRMVDFAISELYSRILNHAFIAAILILAISIIWGISHLIAEVVSHNTFFLYSKRVVERVMALPFSFLEKQKTGDLISRLNNDNNKIADFMGIYSRNMYENLLKYIVTAIYMLWVNWKLGLVCVVMGPVVMLSIKQLTNEMKKLSRISNEMHGKEIAFVSDTIQGIREVKAFNMLGRKKEEYNTIADDLMSFLRKLVMKEHLLSGISGMLFFLPELVIMGLGGYLVLQNEITVGQVLTFRFVYSTIRGGIDGFIKTLPMYKDATATGERVFEILDMPTEEETHNYRRTSHQYKRSETVFRFNHVSFQYGDAKSFFRLHDLSFSVDRNETVALVGPSGSGKSTVLKLMAGFYEPCEGVIEYNGLEVSAQTLADIRNEIAMVSQDPFLFPITIHNNIAYGTGSGIMKSDGERGDIPVANAIVDAARNAGISDFIEQLPREFESLVGERGVKLSGGQMQRMSIARALMKRPSVLLLDEPTSALDVESEHLVQDALGILSQGRTSVIVGHRLSTIKNADRILVFDEGRVVERGTHSDLMDAKGLYYTLYRIQAEEGNQE